MGFIVDSFLESNELALTMTTSKSPILDNHISQPKRDELNQNLITTLPNPSPIPSPTPSRNLNLKLPETEPEMLKLINTLKTQSLNLLKQLQAQVFDMKKARWEFLHGCNLINSVIKHFTDYQQVYKNYIQTCFTFDSEETYNYYIPTVNIKLKPIYRIIYIYEEFIGALKHSISVKTNSPVDKSYNTQLNNLITKLSNTMKPLYSEATKHISYYENLAKFIEFRRELTGFNNCVPSSSLTTPSISTMSPTAIIPNFESAPPPGPFIIQGMLMRMNNSSGQLQNRIFFLFRDVLIYGSRISSVAGFRVHGFIELNDCQMFPNLDEEDDNNETPVSDDLSQVPSLESCRQNGFKIVTNGNKAFIVYALSKNHKERWLSELSRALANAQELNLDNNSETYAHLANLNGHKPSLAEETKNSEANNNNNKIGYSHRANSVVHVTWHRNVTISHDRLCQCLKQNLSGYLLRKFKNSAGWQRLFIVFTNITLFFFKTHEDSAPLASLPLLGYKIEIPNPETTEDKIITKDNVFKLVFRNHMYYFRAESFSSLNRWVTTLERAITI